MLRISWSNICTDAKPPIQKRIVEGENRHPHAASHFTKPPKFFSSTKGPLLRKPSDNPASPRDVQANRAPLRRDQRLSDARPTALTASASPGWITSAWPTDPLPARSTPQHITCRRCVLASAVGRGQTQQRCGSLLIVASHETTDIRQCKSQTFIGYPATSTMMSSEPSN